MLLWHFMGRNVGSLPLVAYDTIPGHGSRSGPVNQARRCLFIASQLFFEDFFFSSFSTTLPLFLDHSNQTSKMTIFTFWILNSNWAKAKVTTKQHLPSLPSFFLERFKLGYFPTFRDKNQQWLSLGPSIWLCRTNLMTNKEKFVSKALTMALTPSSQSRHRSPNHRKGPLIDLKPFLGWRMTWPLPPTKKHHR